LEKLQGLMFSRGLLCLTFCTCCVPAAQMLAGMRI